MSPLPAFVVVFYSCELNGVHFISGGFKEAIAVEQFRRLSEKHFEQALPHLPEVKKQHRRANKTCHDHGLHFCKAGEQANA